ncbi:ExbD/TolR family protein [Dyella jiangningensis]|uniref:Uncharacterized protein n=1 Tax=Dyella jiangningensis TaxID=1379159 RepID=A0A328NXW6_9GAMM|nr:hypothetical protein [Dyella jiangningensis]RAO75028.1 hypothetical protein CA260_12990 [Dyella jiangningensis]
MRWIKIVSLLATGALFGGVLGGYVVFEFMRDVGRPDRVPHTIIYLARDGRAKVGEVVTGDEDVLKRLGPPDAIQVDLWICPSTDYRRVKALLSELRKAGYENIGFGAPNPSDPLCAGG